MASSNLTISRTSVHVILLGHLSWMLLAVVHTAGCAFSKNEIQPPAASRWQGEEVDAAPRAAVILTSHQGPVHDTTDEDPTQRDPTKRDPTQLAVAPSADSSLEQLETDAIAGNPAIRMLRQEAAAARARSAYMDKLPDPTLGANVFAHPIETAAGSQRANMSVMQMLPWLGRLDAQARQACFEALALQQAYASERLKVIGDVRSQWYRLFVLGKQIETNQAHQETLALLIDVANARVATGQASQGDVLLGTLELSKLNEELLTLRQQVATTTAELNRIAGRPAEHPVAIPQQADVALPDWSHGLLRQIAEEQQPEIAAARLRMQATRWGIEVARLKRRPDVSLSASWFAIDDNRPSSSIVAVGRDAWSVGAQVSVPWGHCKYDAMEREAEWKHAASHASADAVQQRYDALLRDLWERAILTDQTATLYRDTLIPQARQTLSTDQQSYANGNVEFDRIIRDFRNLLVLELGYHRAIGELAMTLARIQQAVGMDLAVPAAARLPQVLPAADV
mgnify:CR=1 FL=1